MFGNFDSTKGSIEADEFLSKCTKHFLNLGADSAPTLHLPTKTGEISIFVFEQNAATLFFFPTFLQATVLAFAAWPKLMHVRNPI